MSEMDKDFFKGLADFAKKEAEEKEAKKVASTSGNKQEYEQIKWTGLSHDKMKVVRLLGKIPNSALPPNYPRQNTNEFDSIEFMFAEIKDDNGKKMQLRYPVADPTANTKHIIQEIIDRFNEVKWEKDASGKATKTYPVRTAHPEAYEIVEKANFTSDDKQYKFTKGYKGQKVVVYNVIDRDDDWCKENKHTKLLSKEIKEYNGTEWPAIGVPSYGFIETLIDLGSTYGSYEDFDIGLIRTGAMSNPTEIQNISRLKEKDFLDSVLKYNPDVDKVVVGPLTDEEKAYTRYAVQKLFAPTSMIKIRDRMSVQIGKIDEALGTHYVERIAELAKAEEAILEAKKEETSDTAPHTETDTETLKSTGLTPEKTKYLQGWQFLTDEEKNLIEDVVVVDNKLSSIIYKPEAGECQLCGSDLEDGTRCTFQAPAKFKSCPACGAAFV